MFWRRRKRNQAAVSIRAQKEIQDGLTTDETPNPSQSGEDTTDAVAEEEEEENHNQNLGRQQELKEKPSVNKNDDPNLSPEDRMRKELLETQKIVETLALARNGFTKYQRANYVHKATGKVYEAVIMDVHTDDGLDRPYYTIRYKSGKPPQTVEKQTTRDRLKYVPFDEAKTEKILASKIKFK